MHTALKFPTNFFRSVKTIRKSKLSVIFLVWAAGFILSATTLALVSIPYERKMKEARELLTTRLSDYMTFTQAFSSGSYAAFLLVHTPDGEQKVMQEYGLSPLDFTLVDWIVPDAKRWHGAVKFFGKITLYCLSIGFIAAVGVFLFGLYKWIKTRRFSKPDFVRFLLLVGVTGLAIVPPLYVSSRNDRSKELDEHYAVDDGYSSAYGGLVELSNELFKLYKIQTNSQTSDNQWLIQVEYIKRKVESLIEKLESAKVRKVVQPSLEVCYGLRKWAESSTAISNSIPERHKKIGEAGAEFLVVLEKLDAVNNDVVREWGQFSKYYPMMFEEEAKSSYEAIQRAQDGTYNVLLLFGYRLYDTVTKNLERTVAKK